MKNNLHLVDGGGALRRSSFCIAAERQRRIRAPYLLRLGRCFFLFSVRDSVMLGLSCNFASAKPKLINPGNEVIINGTTYLYLLCFLMEFAFTNIFIRKESPWQTFSINDVFTRKCTLPPKGITALHRMPYLHN